MHVAATDLAAFGGSTTTFTYHGALGRATSDRPDGGRGADRPTAAPVQPVAGGRMDLVRGVVEQIVGPALDAAEIDAIAASVQPVSLAFDRARQAQAAEQRTRAARDAVAWGATLDLRETVSGEGVFAVTGAFTADDRSGRQVAVDIRLMGPGDAGVLPLRLDVHVDEAGLATRLAFAGRTTSGGAAGTGLAATTAAWAGLPVRVHAADGSLRVTTLGDARSARPGGGHLVDLVA